MSDLSLVLFTAIMTAYIVKMFFFLPAYRTPVWFVWYNWFEFPECFVVYNWLALTLKGMNRRYAALDWMTDGLNLRPNDFRLLFNYAGCLSELGEFEKAIKVYEMIMPTAAIPDMAHDDVKRRIDFQIQGLKRAIVERDLKRRSAVVEAARQIKEGK